jgi:Ni/Fe-hydrogenase subunit HybB-like protein
VLCGVGLAAGGFVLTAVVYLFNARRFQPIVRPAILTAFLGYLLVMVALLYDLGRPWNIWHPLVMWNPHSVMFEVAWCVMLYSTVLALEFSGVVFERLKWKRAAKIQHAFSVPLVIAGVLLSTLHQSSLGSLYLIVPGKLHVLWYSPWLPLLFFVSSICAGLAMVILESRLSSRAFGRELEMPLLTELGRILVGLLALLLIIRVFDMLERGAVGAAFAIGYEQLMFQLEICIGVVLPMVLLAFPRIRSNSRALYGTALLVVLGFIMNRLNVAITGFEGAQGGHYIPSWGEAVITLFLIALGFGAFGLAVRHLNVYPEAKPEAPGEDEETPTVALEMMRKGAVRG